MPIDPTISLEAGKIPAPPTGGIPNLLTDPGKVNTLLQLGGNMAVGRALQGAIDPQTGAFSMDAMAKAIAKDPMAAPAAIDALGKGLAMSRAQLDQQNIRRAKLQGVFGSMLIDDKMWSDPNYAKKQIAEGAQSLVNDNIISPQMASTTLQNMPMDKDGNVNLPAIKMFMQQQLFQTLSPQEQVAFKYGLPVQLNVGGEIFTGRQGPSTATGQTEWTFDRGTPTTLTPAERNAQFRGEPKLTPQGSVQTFVTGTEQSRLSGAPLKSTPKGGTETSQPNTNVFGSGSYMPSNMQARGVAAQILANPNMSKLRAKQLIDGLDDTGKAALEQWFANRAKKTQ